MINVPNEAQQCLLDTRDRKTDKLEEQAMDD